MQTSRFITNVGVVAATLATFSAGALARDNGQATASVGVPQAAQAFYATTSFFKTVVSDEAAQTFPGPADFAYQDVPGMGPDGGAFAVIAGPGTLVDIRFTAETQCDGGGTDFGWCGVRVLVDGVEARPAPADFAFDRTNNGEEGSGSWEGHAMDRHICLRNPGGTTRVVPVQVQWRVFSTDGDTTAPSFRLDDTSLTIQSTFANCAVTDAARALRQLGE
jgi:hypothetical protein